MARPPAAVLASDRSPEHWFARSTTITDLVVITAAGLAARLALLPFAGIDTADATGRVWLAWQWLSHPKIITSGVWGPLHFYLLAGFLYLFEDPVYAPILMTILFSIGTSVVMYLFTTSELASRPASFAVGIAFALYPTGVRDSLMALSEPPFLFFLALSLLFLSRARAEGGTWRSSAAAGALLTIASMIRFEAWMLIPFLTLVLWRQPRSMIVFLAISMIHPMIWMIGNAISMGNPFYSFAAASEWTRFAMAVQGRSDRLSSWIANGRSILRLASLALEAVTPWIGLLCLWGIVLAVLKRSRQAIWLLPLVGLSSILSIGAFQGYLIPRPFYTETIDLFFIPYLGTTLVNYEFPDKRSWWAAWAIAAFLIAMVGSTVIELSTPDSPRLSRILDVLTPIRAVARVQNQSMADQIARSVVAHLDDPGDGFVSEFYGWGASPYVALRTRLPPDRILMIEPWGGGLNNEGEFFARHPTGVLLYAGLVPQASWVKESIHLHGDAAVAPGAVLSLSKVASIPWPTGGDGSRGSADPASRPSIEIFRYRVERLVPQREDAVPKRPSPAWIQ